MNVIVVGAGIAGLAAATYLSRKGHKVAVLEASDLVGGRAKSLKRKGSDDLCDVGTQYYHSNYPRALSLMKDVGLEHTISKITGRTRFLGGSEHKSFLLDHRVPLIKSLGVLGNLRVLGFLAHRLLRHRIEPYSLQERPFLDDSRALEVAGSPHVQFIITMLSKVGALAAHDDINLYQALRLCRIILLTDYISLSGGIDSVHRALADRLDVRLDRPVGQVVVEGGTVVGVALRETEEVLAADHVVLAVPPPDAARMIPVDWKAEQEFLTQVRIPPFPMVTMFLDRPLERGVWSYFLPRDHSGAVSMCTDASQKNPAMVPSGKGILQAYPTHPGNVELEGKSDDEIVASCVEELSPHFPDLSSWMDEAHVTWHPRGVPLFPVGQNGRAGRFLEASKKRSGISFCGDYLSGGYLECALWSAESCCAKL